MDNRMKKRNVTQPPVTSMSSASSGEVSDRMSQSTSGMSSALSNTSVHFDGSSSTGCPSLLCQILTSPLILGLIKVEASRVPCMSNYQISIFQLTDGNMLAFQYDGVVKSPDISVRL